MAHIINRIDIMSRAEARVRQLCCMNNIKKNPVYDYEGINERIEKASLIKCALEADAFERENKIQQSVKANKILTGNYDTRKN